MDKTEVSNRYFDWIVSSIATYVKGVNDPVRILTVLHDIPFVVRNRADQNRAFDGEDLRYRFGNSKKIPDAIIAATIDCRPCSTLEMMSALALRAGESVFGYPIINEGAAWLFWEMCRNLNIVRDDISSDEMKQIVSDFLERRYSKNGVGNIFYFPKVNTDIRKTEIWNQAMAYIGYHNDDFVEFLKQCRK